MKSRPRGKKLGRAEGGGSLWAVWSAVRVWRPDDVAAALAAQEDAHYSGKWLASATRGRFNFRTPTSSRGHGAMHCVQLEEEGRLVWVCI